MPTCPKCGSHRFHYELRSAGTRSKTTYYRTGHKSWFLPSGYRTHQSQRKQKSVGICPDCGYISEKVERDGLFYILCIFFFPITLSVLFYRTQLIQLDRKWRALIIAAFWIIMCIIGYASDDQTPSNLVWNHDHTSLSDFDYYVTDTHSIVLTDYHGKERRINIAPSYDIDGRTMPVSSLEDTFTLHTIDSVIITEGVQEISSACFNSCGVKALYLPSTLTSFSGWGYFHNVDAIYFGGTNEQLNNLYAVDRYTPDAAQIVCNSNIYSLLSNDTEENSPNNSAD